MSKKQSGRAEAPLLERPYTIADLLNETGDPVRIKAEADECAAIAKAFDLPAIAALRAEYRVLPEGKIIHVKGELRARLTQTCVVTLEDFDSEIREVVDVRFTSDPATLAAASSDTPGNEAEWDEPPDAISGDSIDLGALTVEHLALGLDPYPRKPGAAFEATGEESTEEAKPSPFEALRALKPGNGG
ncbi:MAG: DUF177 domain-containing protein [Beijerinckiaceae bacterium]